MFVDIVCSVCNDSLSVDTRQLGDSIKVIVYPCEKCIYMQDTLNAELEDSYDDGYSNGHDDGYKECFNKLGGGI